MVPLNSAESLTRFLRSKDISTQEIYDISVSLLEGKYDIYFPQGHIFILELIIDRWNDSKNTKFRGDTNIWEAWRLLWPTVKSDDHKKKLLKNLRIVQLINQTFNEMNYGDSKLCALIYEMLKSANACMITAVSPETALKILGRVIDVVLSCDFVSDAANKKQLIISEVLSFTDLANLTEVPKKVSPVYCSDLLLPSLKYLQQERTVEDTSYNISSILSNFMKKFMFESSRDLTLSMKDFISLHKESLTADICLQLFTNCIIVGNCDSKTLEVVLKLLIDINPTLCSSLLATLNSHKKSVSQEFLESLFDSVIKNKDWDIIKRIIEMNIEIGILKTKDLMELLEIADDDSKLKVWSSLINCHVNAREFTNLLAIWQDYCKVNTLSVFIKDSKLTAVISKNVAMLSATQTRTLITDLVDVIMSQNDIHSVKVLQVIVLGFKALSYSHSLEFKFYLSKLFELEDFYAPEFWQLKYHILELYDELLSEVSFSVKDITTLLELDEKDFSSDLFFTVFKFRELKSFDLSPFLSRFLKYIEGINEEELKLVLLQLFTRWSTLVDQLFDKNSIIHLVKKVLQHTEILPELFEKEDFFEEGNIVHALVSEFIDDTCSELYLHYLLRVPIQCLNKNFRLKILDRIIEKKELKQIDVKLLTRVLGNPTFRSKIETDYQTMLSFVDNPIFQYKMENPVINAVWKNLLLQRKDSKSATNIDTLLQNIQNSLSEPFSKSTYALLHAILSSSKDTEASFNVLRRQFISCIIDEIKNYSGKDEQLLAWLLKVLFVQVKDSATKITIGPLFSAESPIPANVDVKAAYFAVVTLDFNDKIAYLLAQYMVLVEEGAPKELLLNALENKISTRMSEDLADFNFALQLISNTTQVLESEYSDAVIDLFKLFAGYISKENEIGKRTFVSTISHIVTNYSRDVISTHGLLSLMSLINDLLVTKPFIFSQYCTELLFSLTSKVLDNYTSVSINAGIVSEVNSEGSADDIVISCTHILSSLLMFHRFKLSNRSHLVNILICQLLELLADSNRGLTLNSAKAVTRFICNFCEPSNVRNNKQSSLSSAVSNVKRSLRKQLPVILLKFIKLSITNPFPVTIKKELMLAVYALFDLLSQTEMNIINASLDSNGRSYFKSLHADYKKSGKWHDD